MPRHDRAYGRYSTKKQKAGNKRRTPVRMRSKGVRKFRAVRRAQ